MVQAGDIFINPKTGEKAVVRIGTKETNGKRIVADLFISAGGAVVGEHYHPDIHERFTVVSGTVGFSINGKKLIGEIGKTYDVPAGIVHDWWNAGDTEAHVIVDISPGDRFELMIRHLFGLAQDGKTNEKGMPSLLQLSLIATEFDDVIRFTAAPRWVQKMMFGVLRPIARIKGLRAIYPEYTERKPLRAEEMPVAAKQMLA